MPLTFNDMLRGEQIDPTGVLVLRHRPKQKALNKALPWLAVEQPHLYNAYQQAQGEKVEKAFQSAKYVASFMGREPGCALYVGLYEVRGWEALTTKAFASRREMQELFRLGLDGPSSDDPRSSILWFDLALTSFYSAWMGKLVIQWPGMELSWCRRAAKNDFEIWAVHEESVLDADMPAWDELRLTWDELKVIPKKWKAKLQEWRGVYFIYDQSDGKGYVGSAYGDANILGRWENYAKSGDGGNRLLKKRRPDDFSFSILQRLSPDMPTNDVIQIETTWKARLHTRAPLGLNDN